MKKTLIVLAVLAVISAVCFFAFQKSNESEKTVKTEEIREPEKTEETGDADKIMESAEDLEEDADAIKTENYDVVIVGAGMAGLSAAYQVKQIDKSLKMIILEKDNRVGGRIFNKKFNDLNYSVGASMGYQKAMMPAELKDKYRFVSQDAPKGVYFNDRLSLKNTSKEAFNELTGGKIALNHYKFLNFMVHIEQMADRAENRFYKPDEYFEDFDLVSYYESLLSAHTSLNSEVTKIKSKGDHVEIVYMKDGKKFKTSSKAVVVATPANVVRKVVKGLSETTKKFLDTIKYRGTRIISIVLKNDPSFVPFSYINIDPKYDFWKIDRYFLKDQNYAFYTLYSNKLDKLNEKDFFGRSFSFLQKIGVGNFKEEDVLHYEVVYWNLFETNYCEDGSSECEMSFANSLVCNGIVEECINNPVKGIFLAGDYTLLYGGVYPAWCSGKDSAVRALSSLGLDVKAYIDVRK